MYLPALISNIEAYQATQSTANLPYLWTRGSFDAYVQMVKNNPVDFLGVNYYQPVRVKAKEHLPNPEAPFTPSYYFDFYDMPGKQMNPYRGWEIYAQGIL